MRIGVVGLGLAGLRTAMLIERAGAEALLFEAREQAGGRLRAAPENGAPLYEAGGEWIDADHHRMLALLKEFRLTAKYRGDEGDDLDRIGLLGWLAGFQLYAGREGGEMCAWRLPVSSRELCSRMLSTLNAVPSFGSPLGGVRQERGGVTLFFSDGAVEVDRVVLTLPPRRLERVWFDPPLKPEQFMAIRACRMGRAVKIVWQFDRHWWRDEGWSGSLLSDGPLQHVWEASIREAPILCAFVCGSDAVRWRRMEDPVRAGLEALSRLCPAAATNCVF